MFHLHAISVAFPYFFSFMYFSTPSIELRFIFGVISLSDFLYILALCRCLREQAILKNFETSLFSRNFFVFGSSKNGAVCIHGIAKKKIIMNRVKSVTRFKISSLFSHYFELGNSKNY